MRSCVLLMVALVGWAPRAVACEWDDFARAALEGESVAVPSEPVRLMFEMARDLTRAERVLDRVGAGDRCQTRRLIDALSLGQPEALRVVPDIHVVRDLGPGPGERLPTWSDVQRQGLRLIEAVAIDPSQGRDVRLQRDLERARSEAGRDKPSEVGRRVLLWRAWWADRGDDPVLNHDVSLIPRVDAWVQGLAAPLAAGQGLLVADVLRKLVDDGLRRRMLREQIGPLAHEGLVAECIHWIRKYQLQFQEAGFEAPQWNPRVGRREGYRADDLRDVCMDILDAVTDVTASGSDHGEVIESWLAWWRRGRFEARFYRDPTQVPSLAPWLAPIDAPSAPTEADFVAALKQWYVADGFRELLLDRLGPGQRSAVADLMHWLTRGEEEAMAAGYSPAYNRRPLRPSPEVDPIPVRIPWSRMQEMIREMLTRVTGAEGPQDLGLPGLEETRWTDWWRQHRAESRWYRADQAPDVTGPPSFAPERAPRSG